MRPAWSSRTPRRGTGRCIPHAFHGDWNYRAPSPAKLTHLILIKRPKRQADRELGDRQGAERRYSDGLRQQAVAYWRAREATGDGVREVATALGIAPVSLRRWAQDSRFRPVRVLADAAPAPPRLVVVIDATGVRIEGVDVETAAQLIARLR